MNTVILLSVFAKLEFPGGDVNLSDGGFIKFDAGLGLEEYRASHPVYGAVQSAQAMEDTFEDLAETGSMSLIPNPEATVSDWWRDDLFDCRMRIWMGEVDTDGFTVSTATLIKDLLVDTYERLQGNAGEDVLRLEFIGRSEKLFLINEGNVLSSRFHQTVYAGERGFDNCTGLKGFVAWGTEAPPRSAGSSGRGNREGNGGGPNSRPHLH